MNSVRDWSRLNFGLRAALYRRLMRSPQCIAGMRTTSRGTLSQFAAWLESGCLRSDGYFRFAVPHICQHQANMGHPSHRKTYLDLKRIKNRRARLAMRCGLLRNL